MPGSIVALLAGTAAVALFDLPVATIGTMFGGIPSGLPSVSVPEFRADLILPLLQPAFTVAVLAALESLLSAVVADSMTGDRHNSNAELVAQGVANIVVPMVGGIPVTGAIARTATNIRAGARTPVASVVHAITLLLVVLLLAPLAASIPLAVLAAVLFVVAWNMGEWREIPGILRLEAADIAVWVDHVRADGDGRPDHRRRSRAGAGGVALHLPRDRDDQRERRHAGVHRGGRGALAAGKERAALRDHPAHSRPVPVRDHRQADRRRGR